VDELLDRLSAKGRADGVVLALHGAMVAEGHPDAEADVVRAARGIVGDIPVAVTLDLHANPSDDLAHLADVMVSYDTFPHVDMEARGAEAMQLVVRMLHTGRRPATHLVKLPLLTVPQMQETAEHPLRSAMRALERAEADTAVWTASITPGYPYSDVQRLGLGVYVAADDPDRARGSATEVAEQVWGRRAEYMPELLEPDEAILEAARGQGPVVLVDVADNVGGGSPGDGTILLRALQARGRADAAVVVWDPWSIERVYASKDEVVSLEVGGHATDDLGDPVAVRGSVRRLGPVTYRRAGRYMHGQEVGMGRVAVVEAAAGKIVLTERRVMPFDDDHLRAVGIDPQECGVIVAKSATAWKGAFGAYAARGIYVRTPGYCPSDVAQLKFEDRPRPMFPLEEEATWP
jgi:microcystin degradation protein MlrC